MSTHPHLRAYIAGLFIPSLVLPVMLFGGFLVRSMLQDPFPFERGLIFPLAFVPLLWGLWNLLWLCTHERTRLPISLHGALLPLLLLPMGTCVATWLGILSLGNTGVTWFHNVFVPYAWIAPCYCAVLVGYYLVWKYVVGFLNRVLGIA